MLDVGQGDAILVTTPNGERVVVDGGPSGIVLAQELGDVLPHWQRQISAVVLTHADADHVGGLPSLLERFNVRRVYDNGEARDTAVFGEYEAAAGTRQTLRRGDVFEIDGVRFETLWPPSGALEGPRNAWSVVLRVTYGEATILLTGDIEEEAQRALLADGRHRRAGAQGSAPRSQHQRGRFLQRYRRRGSRLSRRARETVSDTPRTRHSWTWKDARCCAPTYTAA